MAADRLVNTYDQLRAAVAAKFIPKKHALSITYLQGTTLVESPFFHTDLKAAWYHHKKKAFFGNGVGHARRADAAKQAILWVQEKYGYKRLWKRNAHGVLVPFTVQLNFPIPRGPRAPAKVDDRIVEIEKNQRLYVSFVSPDKIGMCYRPGDPVAVTATWDDFKKFFKVER